MKTETLKYIHTCAHEREHASVQKLSCADVRQLLAERAELLQALEAIATHLETYRATGHMGGWGRDLLNARKTLEKARA